MVGPESEPELPLDRNELKVGTKLVGEVLRTGAPGQPHSGILATAGSGSGDAYAGRAVFACVA